MKEMYEQIAKPELLALVSKNEKIMWQGRPDKTCFIFEAIFNPFLIVALLWGAIDFGFIAAFLHQSNSASSNIPAAASFMFLGFFALHLMPVWIYLFGVLFSVLRYKNTSFAITDQAVYISNGIFTQNYERKPFSEMSHVNLSRGIFDQWLGVGDVVLTSTHDTIMPHGKRYYPFGGTNICDIRDYMNVYQLVKRLQTDIYADTMYPNDLRPDQNHGYNTQYTPKD
jgi:membrane protein YdbS with pleckstrin-like domain